MRGDVPIGWTTSTVDELAWRIQYGTSAKTGRSQHGIPVIRMGNIQDGKIVMDDVKTLPLDHPEFPGLLLDEGDVLFNRTNSPELVGKSAVFIGSEPTSFASYLIRISLKTGCLPKWLAWYINSHHGREWVAAVVNQQVGQANVSGGKLRELEVPVPPINEQRRIVAKLEALLAKVDASRKRLERIPVILKRFRQAVLAAACDGRLTEDWRRTNVPNDSFSHCENGPKFRQITEDEFLFNSPTSWNWCRLGSVATLVNGDRGKNYPNKSEYVADGVPFINAGHINQDGSLSIESMNYISKEKYTSLGSGKINKGDLLYCLRGTLGKTAYVDQIKEGAIASSLVIIRFNSALNIKFVYFMLTSPYGIALVDRFDNGSAQPNLSAESVRQYVLPVPPISEQAEIVKRVSALFTFADQIEARYTKAKAQVDRLTQSILAKAFRGELVPQDPNDEPADALLSRLAVTPSEASAPARRRGRPPRVQPATPPVAPAAPTEDREAPAQADLTPETIRQAYREVLASIPSPFSEDNLLRAVAFRLGFQRLGSRIRAKLQAVCNYHRPNPKSEDALANSNE